MSKIKEIKAEKIINSLGDWTIRTTAILSSGATGSGEVPAGISTGKFEATLVPPGQAIENITSKISPELHGENALNQKNIDQLLLELDGTERKGNLGGNAILATSLAVCNAAAREQDIPLYQHIRNYFGFEETASLPNPMLLIIEGGKHGAENLDIQEFMVIPPKKPSFEKTIEAGINIYKETKKLLGEEGYATTVGTEGGFSPQKMNLNQALDIIEQACKNAHYEKVKITLDVAANSFASKTKYKLKGLSKTLSGTQLLDFYNDLKAKHPRLYSIEDPFDENHLNLWKKAQKEWGDDLIVVVGDDLLVTNPKKIKHAVENKLVGGAIIKPNQIGTISEAVEFSKIAQKGNLKTVVSHRSGETNSSFIADLAFAINADFIKTGAPTRGERVAKYNRLLEIERSLG